jgi:hypothetical protein
MTPQVKTQSPRPLTIGLAAVLAILAIYFLPLGIVLLDEVVFRTHFIARTLPHWVEDVFESVYPFVGK